MKSIWLALLRMYCLWDLARAREFSSGLEKTIVGERGRARRWVEDAELTLARVEREVIFEEARSES